MLKPLGIDIVGAGERMHFVRRGIGAIMRMQSVANCLGIQYGRYFEAAKLEAINCRLQFAL